MMNGNGRDDMASASGRVLLTCALLVGAMAPSTAGAQPKDVELKIAYSAEFTRCMRGSRGVTPAMLECTGRERDRWDARLNATYQRIMGSKDYSENARTELREAQRAWIAYRQAACRAAGDLTAEGGTMSRVVAADCVLRMTAQRAGELEDLLR